MIHPAGVRRVKPSAHRAGVDGAAAFGSASFECGAVPLASFQRWVAFGIPRNAARAKGFVTFLEDPEVTYDFHLSGRRRVEIERAPAIPAGSRARRRDDAARRKQTRLVLIGPGVDPAASLDALREMREIPHSDRHSASSEDEPKISSEDVAARNAKVAERMRWARALVASDPRLELVEYHDTLSPPFSAAALAECVHFRLTGAALNGMSCETMEREHGVDFNRVNAEFVRALNAAGAGGGGRRRRSPGAPPPVRARRRARRRRRRRGRGRVPGEVGGSGARVRGGAAEAHRAHTQVQVRVLILPCNIYTSKVR